MQLLASYKPDVSSAANGLLEIPAPEGTLTSFYLCIGADTTGQCIFNVSKNGTDLFSGNDRIIIASGGADGESAPLSVPCIMGDLLSLNLTTLSGTITGPILLYADYDE